MIYAYNQTNTQIKQNHHFISVNSRDQTQHKNFNDLPPNKIEEAIYVCIYTYIHVYGGCMDVWMHVIIYCEINM